MQPYVGVDDHKPLNCGTMLDEGTTLKQGSLGDRPESRSAGTRWAEGSPVWGAAKPWMVLHTKARQEKAVARYLEAAGLVFYLPLMDRVTLLRGRKLRSNVPVLPGYVFLSGDVDDGYAAISTKRVCRVISVVDQERLVHELRQIHEVLERGADLYRCPFAVVGTRCRITSGPFMGIEGVVSSKLGSNRLALVVQMLGRGAVLEIDGDLLEPVD